MPISPEDRSTILAGLNGNAVISNQPPSPPAINTTDVTEWPKFIQDMMGYFGLTRAQIAVLAHCSENAIISILKGKQKVSPERRQALYDSYSAMEGILHNYRGNFRDKTSLFSLIHALFTASGTEAAPRGEVFMAFAQLPPSQPSVFPLSDLSRTQGQQQSNLDEARANFRRDTREGLGRVFGMWASEMTDDPEQFRHLVDKFYAAMEDEIDPCFLLSASLANREGVKIGNMYPTDHDQGFAMLVESLVAVCGQRH